MAVVVQRINTDSKYCSAGRGQARFCEFSSVARCPCSIPARPQTHKHSNRSRQTHRRRVCVCTYTQAKISTKPHKQIQIYILISSHQHANRCAGKNTRRPRSCTLHVCLRRFASLIGAAVRVVHSLMHAGEQRGSAEREIFSVSGPTGAARAPSEFVLAVMDGC